MHEECCSFKIPKISVCVCVCALASVCFLRACCQEVVVKVKEDKHVTALADCTIGVHKPRLAAPLCSALLLSNPICDGIYHSGGYKNPALV